MWAYNTMFTSCPAAGITALSFALGAGNDTLSVDACCGTTLVPITADGEEGNDSITTGAGPDRLIGGPGTDSLNGNAGADLLTGGGGPDTFAGGPGTDRVSYADGRSEGVSVSMADPAAADDGGPLDGAPGARDRIGADVEGLTGTPAADRLDASASAGAFSLDGANGDDTLLDGTGNGTALGGAGDDVLVGQGGNETLDGGPGADEVDGAGGSDDLTGGSGPDVISAGAGADAVHAADGERDTHRLRLRRRQRRRGRDRRRRARLQRPDRRRRRVGRARAGRIDGHRRGRRARPAPPGAPGVAGHSGCRAGRRARGGRRRCRCCSFPSTPVSPPSAGSASSCATSPRWPGAATLVVRKGSTVVATVKGRAAPGLDTIAWNGKAGQGDGQAGALRAAAHRRERRRPDEEGDRHGDDPLTRSPVRAKRRQVQRVRRHAAEEGVGPAVVPMTMLDVDANASGGVDPRVWLRVLAGLFGLFWGFFFYGLIDLFAFAQGAQFHAALLLSTGWGLLYLFLVAAPLVALAVRASAVLPSALAQVALVAAAVITAAALSSSPRYLSVAAWLLVTVGVLALAARDRPWDALGTWRWSAFPGTLVLIAVAPCCAYAWTSARTTGTAQITDDTWGLDHWPAQAALPLAVLLISALAAGHPSGWRVPAWSAGAAAAWFAIVCWLEPHLVASMSRPWAAATLLWSVAFIAATHIGARRRAPGRPDHRQARARLRSDPEP